MLKIYYKYIGNKLINKILMLFIAANILVLSVLSGFIAYSINHILIEKEFESLKIVLNNVDNYLTEKDKFVRTFISQAYIQKALLEKNSITTIYSYLLTEMDNTSSNYFYSKPVFDSYFTSVFSLDQDIISVSIYKLLGEGNIYQYTKYLNETISYNDYPNKDFLKIKEPFLYTDIKTSIHPTRHADYIMNRSANVFTITFPIKNLNPDKIIGLLIIDFDTNGIKKLISRYSPDIDGYLLVLLETGEVIYDSTEKYYGKKYTDMSALSGVGRKVRLEGKDSYVVCIPGSVQGMVIAGIIPEETLMKNVRTIQFTIFLASLLCVSFCILFMVLSSKKISKRIRVITNTMKEMKDGNLQKRIPIVKANDELNEIAVSFNKMSAHLEGYIERVYASEIKQKDAEIMALEAQIRPHFLHNTLEAIRMKAVLEGADKTAEMIFMLSKLFRSMVKEKHMVKAGDEVKYCRLYLSLFEIRYEEKFSYEVNVDDDILEYFVIKHILQPIVENCIVHAFNPRAHYFRVTIKGSKSGNHICFIISDNGKGIHPKKLSKLQENLDMGENEQNGSIGLINVNERIKMFFGPDYGLFIKSEPEKGTEVTLKIPIIGQEDLNKYVQIQGSFGR